MAKFESHPQYSELAPSYFDMKIGKKGITMAELERGLYTPYSDDI